MRTIKKLLREFFVGLMVFALLLQSVGCSYSRVLTYSEEENYPRMGKLVKKERRFFVHAQSDTFELVNCQVTLYAIQGEKSELDANFYYFPGRKDRYKSEKEPTLTKEVHIYLPPEYAYSETDNGMIRIPYKEADHIRVVNKDVGITILQVLGGAFVALIAVYLVGMAIVYG